MYLSFEEVSLKITIFLSWQLRSILIEPQKQNPSLGNCFNESKPIPESELPENAKTSP